MDASGPGTESIHMYSVYKHILGGSDFVSLSNSHSLKTEARRIILVFFEPEARSLSMKYEI